MLVTRWLEYTIPTFWVAGLELATVGIGALTSAIPSMYNYRSTLVFENPVSPLNLHAYFWDWWSRRYLYGHWYQRFSMAAHKKEVGPMLSEQV